MLKKYGSFLLIIVAVYTSAQTLCEMRNKSLTIDEQNKKIAELTSDKEHLQKLVESSKGLSDSIYTLNESIKANTESNKRTVDELRKINYGVAKNPSFHYKELPSLEGYDFTYQGMLSTIKNVVKSMPNLKSDETLFLLGMETLQIETRIGSYSMVSAAKKGDYGIAQIRGNTAQETLWWLKQIKRDDVLEALQKLTTIELRYDTKIASSELIEELKRNVPLSLGLMYQYYWRRNPDFQSEISTVELRAELWKREYNSSIGQGTVDKYIQAQKGI